MLNWTHYKRKIVAMLQHDKQSLFFGHKNRHREWKYSMCVSVSSVWLKELRFQKWNASYTEHRLVRMLKAHCCIGIWSIHRKWNSNGKTRERKPNTTTLLFGCVVLCVLSSEYLWADHNEMYRKHTPQNTIHGIEMVNRLQIYCQVT